MSKSVEKRLAIQKAAIKEHPILFRPEMVRAILDGRKTQTRRVIKKQPDEDGLSFNLSVNQWHDTSANIYKCPYGVPGRIVDHPKEGGWYDVQWEQGDDWVRIWNFEGGECWGWNKNDDYEAYHLDTPPYAFKTRGDKLWVRETFCLESSFGFGDIDYNPPFDDGRPVNRLLGDDHFSPYWEQAHYRATDPTPELVIEGMDGPGCRWKPSIHMPRWASRIDLEVVSVRVERPHDISEEDAKAEGMVAGMIEPTWDEPRSLGDGYSIQGMGCHASPAGKFQILWIELNEKRGYGWDVNPWVWVVEFKRIKP